MPNVDQELPNTSSAITANKARGAYRTAASDIRATWYAPPMGGLGELVSALIAASEGLVPGWAWPVGLVALLVLAAPSMRRNARTNTARRLFRTATLLRAAERDAQENAALAAVVNNRDGLVVLADLALQEGRPRIVPEIVGRLRALRGREADVRRIEREQSGPQPATPLEAALLVERLLEAGVDSEAHRRLESALMRWPTDSDLVALRARSVQPAPR